jgi:SAM-dependent methyltransferase
MSDAPEENWDAFSAFYDDFTEHFDYDAWTGTLEALAREHGVGGKRLLDIACGTGKSFEPFLDRGYDVVGCDISRRMLEMAERRCGGRARLLHRDMRRLEVLGAFDLVLLINDALNYVVSDEDLRASLTAAAANLADQGILVLDINNLLLYRTMYATTTTIDRGHTFSVWRGQTPPDLPPGGPVRSTLEVFTHAGEGVWRRTSIVQIQRHHTAETMKSVLEAAGLRTLAIHGQDMAGTIHREFDERSHFKIIYIVGHRAGVEQLGDEVEIGE